MLYCLVLRVYHTANVYLYHFFFNLLFNPFSISIVLLLNKPTVKWRITKIPVTCVRVANVNTPENGYALGVTISF